MRLAMAQAATDAIASSPVLLRASASLLGKAIRVPDADAVERAALTVGLAGSHATGREARLARALAQSVHAESGDIPGTVVITATDADPDRAASIATTVAEAFISDRDEHAAETRRAVENAARSRLDDMKAAALAAHRRFADLGGTAFDPGQALAVARARTDAAQSRLESIRSIVASGSPPLSDSKDVPSMVEALQNAYLDLTHQLAVARETLGDRHMTVISLQEGVRRSSANLTAEWKRLARIAAADFADARARETNLREANVPGDPTRRAALDEARAAAQLADAAVTQADAASHDIPEEARFRLIERAPSPGVNVGFSQAMRTAIAGLVGLATFGMVLLLPRRRANPAETVPNRLDREPLLDQNELPRVDLSAFETDEPVAAVSGVDLSTSETTMSDPVEDHAETVSIADEEDILSRVETIEEQLAPPTIMVAANDVADGTRAVALAIGRSAAAAGLRVLLIESERTRAELAALADPGAEPILVEAFGTLRVALPAETGEGLFLAPSLRDGTRIASTLSQNGGTSFVGQFDLIVIDRGSTADSAEPELVADGYLRVAPFTSPSDDERFMSTLGVTSDAFMGTIVQRDRLPKSTERLKLGAPLSLASTGPQRPVPGTPFHASRRVAPPFPSSARRRVGVR